MAAGATAEDWARLEQLGLTADLLPVVSDTTATIDPDSKIRDIGKTPSRFNARGNVTGIAAWTQQQTTARQVAAWAQDSRLGICLQTRTVRAIDVDIADPVVSRAVRDIVVLVLGDLPCRWRENSGKLLLAFNMPGDYSKRVLKTEHGVIEFLATGQQFIAHGTHPSGVRYQWTDLGIVDVLGQFPEVEPEEFEILWEGLANIYQASGVVSRAGASPTTQRRRADAEPDPVLDWLEAHGQVLEYDSTGKAHVRCPWEHEHSSDTGPGATSWLMAGVGGFSEGRFRCLHAHCAGRGSDEYLDAVGYTAEQFDIVVHEPSTGAAAVDPGPWPTFSRGKDGLIESTATNAALALARPDFCGYRLGWDEFMGRRTIAADGEAVWREFRDSDYFLLRQQLEQRGFKKPSHELVREAVRFVSEQHSYDSAIDWARGLRWDGVPRVEAFLARYAGAADTDYHRSVSLYLWTALAGRCLVPGIKTDMVPVLIGAQGTGKTTLVESLAPTPEAFVEINLGNRNEEQTARQLRGKLVGEIAELRGLAGRDAEDIKAWITRRFEEIRALYTEFHSVYWRRLVMIGTGNKEEFLDDETGERRWLPVRVGLSDITALQADRDQLWAEAVVLFDRGGVQWRDAQTLAVGEHSKFKVQDSWAEAVEAWLADDGMGGPAPGQQRFTVREVLAGALRFADSQINKSVEMRMARVLTTLGYQSVPRWEHGKNRKKWERAN